jgi:hypothetical protein
LLLDCKLDSFCFSIDVFFLFRRVGAIFLRKTVTNVERLNDSGQKVRYEETVEDAWGGAGTWRLVHRILGSLVVALGLVNISLGVFLAVLPLPVWIIWYIYLGFLLLILVGMEIVKLMRGRGTTKGGSYKPPGKTNKLIIEFI